MALTSRQREVLDFIRDTELRRGVGPTTREVQAHFGFASQTAAVDHIRALERKGALDKNPRKARAVTTSPPRLEIVHVPIFGTVPAGIPELVEQQPDGFVAVDRRAVGVSKEARLFATRVRGDSMIGAHILEGDIAVFEVRAPQANSIVAALIDGETTLKRYVQKKGKAFLHAENPAYPDLIPARELVIQGVLVHLQRNAANDQEPPLVRTNLETVSIIANGGTRLFFFPDRLLIFSSNGVGAVNYRHLRIQYSETRFILDTSAPRDAQVVDWTWQYVNKKGGPDRRFANNPRRPIIHCERLHFTSPSGLNEVFQFSRPGVAMAFEQAVRQLIGVLNAPPASTPLAHTPVTPGHSSATDSWEDARPIKRTILVVGAFCVLALIVWAASTGGKHTAQSEAGTTPLPTASVQSANPATTQPAALPRATALPLGPTATPRISASSEADSALAPRSAGNNFNRLVSESQKRAVIAYPALGKLGSPINTRSVKRYTALKAMAGPLLKSPTWPEKVAQECAGELPPH